MPPLQQPLSDPYGLRPVHPSDLRPMRLLRIPEPFDHPDWLYEVKFDGFRALAHVIRHHQLVSRMATSVNCFPLLRLTTRVRGTRLRAMASFCLTIRRFHRRNSITVAASK